MFLRFVLCAVAVFSSALDGPAQSPRLVADINRRPVPTSSQPGGFQAIGNEVWFTAHTASVGVAVHSTRMVLGTTRRRSAPRNWLYLAIVGRLGSKLILVGRTRTLGTELYLFDTAASTPSVSLLRDIVPGAGSSFPRSFITHRGALFFTAMTAAEGGELWRTDGTTAGTRLVRDIHKGPKSSGISGLTVFNGRLHFAATDGTRGIELWRTDGTTAGTALVADIASGTASSNPRGFTAFNNKLYFSARTAANGSELWSTDGTTAGTKLHHDVVPGAGSSYSFPAIAWRGHLYFSAPNPRGFPILHRTDGTKFNSLNVDFRGGAIIVGRAPRDALVFQTDISNGGLELGIFDGAKAAQLDLWPGPQESRPSLPIRLPNGSAIFAAAGTRGRELYVTDGTIFGTRLLADLNTTATNASSYPDELWLAPNGSILFRADDGIRGNELWMTDGTKSGTLILADIYKGVANDSARPAHLTDANGQLFFQAVDGINGWELWTSDGTTAGTRIATELVPGSGSSYPTDLHVTGSKLLFLSYTKTPNRHLISYDLKRRTTTQIVGPQFFSQHSKGEFVEFRGKTWFRAGSTWSGELWTTDGTQAGTSRFKLFPWGNPGVTGLTVYRGELYFSATDGKTGQELWVTDGTTSGTRLVADLSPGRTGSYPQHLTVVRDRLVFTATTSTLGRELFVSDGTAKGTIGVDIRPGTKGSAPGTYGERFAVAGGYAWFGADDGTRGRELFRTDGTVRGTTLVKDIAPGALGSAVSNITGLDNRVLLQADDGKSGSELWLSNGTPAGTVLVKDIMPGSEGCQPHNITPIGKRRAVFYATYVQGTAGGALHITDGTSNGTRSLGIAIARDLTVVGKTLYFHGYAPATGTELYAMDLSGFAHRFGTGCSAGGRTAVLDATDPILNRHHTLMLRDAPANKPGLILVGARASSATLVHVQGCRLYVDLMLPTFGIPIRTDSFGRATLTQRIPDDARLLGVEIAVQAGIGPTSAAPFGVDLSSAVSLVPGR